MDDRSWMHADRRSLAYELGVASFLKFAIENGKDCNNMPCPCCKCGNMDDFPISVIKTHLYYNGVDESYKIWKWHGEKLDTTSSSSEDVDSCSIESDSVDGNFGADYTIEMDRSDDDNEFSSECNEFKEFVEDANKPLYPGCTRFTKLGVLVKLYNLKAKHGMSDAAYSDWLIAFGEHLPEGNEIPTSVYEAKKTLGALGMDYRKIHACPNDCILYRKQYIDDTHCPTCGVCRWKVGKNSKVREGVPAKVLWYFPPIPRFQRMFQSTKTASSLTWHSTDRPKDGLLRHPADALTWKSVDEKWPDFGSEARNLRLALSSDGFNPHSSLSSKYSCWPVILVNYNLPPWLCMKRKYMMLTLLISGPKQPGNDIDVYLEPLIDDLKVLWEGVQGVYDASRNEYFTLKAALFWTINDFPAYSNLSGSIVKGYNACPICVEKTLPKRLVHGQKMAYMRHRRWKGRNHPYRKQRAAFDNHQEFDPPPSPLSGEEVLKRMEEEVLVWPFGKKHPPPPYKGDDDENRPCWKKKSIFFELEYWKFLPVRHCLDVMHIEKNVCDSLLGTLLNIPGKTKDGIKARLDLVEMGIRTELAPNIDGPKKNRLPLASWNLTLDEKKSVCGCFFCMKVPHNYCSNIHNLVSMDELRLNGMKSHDCHILMQQLLPVALRAVLDKPVRVAVIRLCLFFTDICSKSFEVSRLPKIQSDIVETLCLLEMYFPPSFFDIMIHLTVHLVREVELCGPVFYRWMYPFERYMKVCKGYVRNRNHPEGCIAENYIAEEAVEFLAERLLSDQTIGIPKQQCKDCKPTSGAKVSSIYGSEFNQAHLCVLQNMEEFRGYFLEHMEYLKEVFPKFKKNKKWLKDKQNKSFADWLKIRVEQQLSEPENNISETVRWIADGPSHEVAKFCSYKIDGIQFYTKSLDDVRACQNSGVYLEADTMLVASARDRNPIDDDMSFYGVIDEIWELDYTQFSKPLFKCDWAESTRGVKVDDLGFTLVNLNRKGHLNDKFAMATSVYQIFYVQDPVDPRWSVVLRVPQREFLDLAHDDELGDTIIDQQPITDRMPCVESEEGEIGYIRVANEGILVMAHSKAVSTPTKNTTKSLKVRKSKSSKSKKVCTSAASVSKGKNRGKKIEEDEGSTGGLKLLKRHPVTMSKMTKGRVLKKRLRVQFDRNGSPVGKNAEKMQSYIGVLARTKIPISIASWPGVDKKKKNTLWETVLTAFILGPEHRKMVLQSAGAKWREFKSRLTTVYVLPYVDDPEMLQFPPDDYRFITVDEWTAFVTERTKPAFLELHEAQKARRLKNQYDHHMSRKGYAGLREELSQTMPEEEIDRAMLWIKGRQTKQGTFKVDALKDTADKIETLKQKERSGELEISGSDDVLTLALGTPEHPGRVRGVGGYVNPTDYFHLPKRKKESVQESVRLSVRRIFEEEKQKLEEELKEKILAEEREKIVAAERAFWCSRIEQLEAKINGTVLEEGVPHVGEGKAAANEYISGQASCSKTSPKSATKLDNTMEGAVTKCLDMMERNMVQKHKKKTTKVSKPKIAKAPTEEVEDRAKENEERVAAVNNDNLEIEVVDMTSLEKQRKVTPTEKECKLALGDIGHIVAIATVMTSDDPSATCHGTPLGDENLRVSIYAAIKEQAMIPFPIKDEIMTVKQAMGSWVMWPKNLIIYDEKKKASGKARKKQKRNQFSPYSDAEFDLQSLPSSLPASLKKLCEWGKEGFKDGKAICFYKEEPVFGYHAKSFLLDVDVMRLAHMAEITSSCIVVYMRYLHDVLKQFKMQDMVAFIDPTLTGEIGCGSPSQRSQNIKDRLITASPNQIFLLPYNASSHWMLTVINPETGTVYFMDPLKRRLITGEWRDVVDTAIGLFKADRIKKGRGSVEWKNMAGIPPQPNDKECGYFVMRYMRDIIHDTTLSFADKWGRRANHTYGQVELDEVRNEIANYVIKNLLKL